MKARTVLSYAGVGLLLALGAPLGWFGWRILVGAARGGVFLELTSHTALYLYLAIGTSLAFAISGGIAGVLAERLNRANEKLRALATTDELTRLRNPRYFHEWLAVECARADRDGGPLALVMADLDHFKALNDRLGHAVGDHALAHAAAIIASNVRAGDVACRVGGEEFVIIAPRCDVGEARAVAERIRATLAGSPFHTAAGADTVTASFGIALYTPGEGPDRFFERVDAALYSAKRAGRNRVEMAPAISAIERAG